METPSWTNKIFGDQLRQARRAAHLMQEDLAFRAGLDRTYISPLERRIKSPTLNTFFRLCRVLAQSPEMLIVRVYQKWLEAEQPNAAVQCQDGATEEE
jgi:transcriptional regulator with XRE-family HTH domain